MQVSPLIFGMRDSQGELQRMQNDIALLQADMQKNPQNSVIDQRDIDLDQKDEYLLNQQLGLISQYNASGCKDQSIMNAIMSDSKEIGINEQIITLDVDITKAQTDIGQNPQNTVMDELKIARDEVEEAGINIISKLSTEYEESKDPKVAKELDAVILLMNALTGVNSSNPAYHSSVFSGNYISLPGMPNAPAPHIEIPKTGMSFSAIEAASAWGELRG